MSTGNGSCLVLHAAAATDVGPRSDNQDSGCAGATLIAVADGVSGSPGGAVASALVIECLAERWAQAHGAEPRNALTDAIAEADQRIDATGRRRPRLRTMATTLTAMSVRGSSLDLAHIGDSRGYLVRDGELRRLTRDQTVVQSLLDAGVISADEARVHPWRAVLTSALRGSGEDRAALQVGAVPIRPGDRLLICSDGLSGVVAEEALQRLLRARSSPESVAEQLLRTALEAPASDNVTVVVADVVEEAAVPAGPLTLVGAAATSGLDSAQLADVATVGDGESAQCS